MIRHRPFGLGHPYRLEADQRVPARPVADEPIALRATTADDVDTLVAEVTIDGVARPQVARRVPVEEAVTGHGGSSGTGHLAAAAARLVGAGRRAWVVELPPQRAGARLRYRFVSGDGRQRTRTWECVVGAWRATGGSLSIDAVGPDRTDRFIEGSVRWLRADAGPWRARFALRLEPGEHVMGFGERFDHLDQRGRRLDAVVFEQYKGQGDRTYLPMPFAIVAGGSGWGFYVRTSRRTWYDVGASEPDRLWVEVELDPDEPEPAVDVALFGGTPRDVLGAFLAETGEPRVPPDWVFRPWMSANEWNTEARVRAEVQRSLDMGIPVGVVVIEAWSDETTFTAFRDARYEVHPDGAPHRLADFTFPADGAWPDPVGLVRWLHEHDIRLLLWQVPLQRAFPTPRGQARADRDTMVARGYAVRDASGRPYRNRGWWFPGSLMPDFTSPEATAWWVEKRRYLVEEVGIDGFKTDGGEHAWGHDLRYADGTRGDVTNSRYPVLYAKAYHDLMASAGREPVTFSRAGFTGAQTVPLHWAGDEDSTWEAYRASVTAGLTAGASGVFFWGWDLAGFSGDVPDPELYLRAAAMACLCPVMQYHAEFHHHRPPWRDRTPWNVAERTGHDRVVPVFRRFARLRERLLPYLTRQARACAEGRRPLMRALAFEWPEDEQAWAHPNQYLLGDELLVAPVVEPGAMTWEAYLPPGDWVDAWTGAPVAGGQTVMRDVPIEVIPAWVRAEAAADLVPLFAAPDGEEEPAGSSPAVAPGMPRGVVRRVHGGCGLAWRVRSAVPATVGAGTALTASSRARAGGRR